MKPQVKLISWTQDPIETIYLLWQASRTQGCIPTMSVLKFKMKFGLKKEVYELFQKILASAIPVAENISFTFLLENVSISFREQMVRHRVGVKVGERIGMDYIPDIHNSTWWGQSMRVLDMSKFCDNEEYHIPESIEKSIEAKKTLQASMSNAAYMYKKLLGLGIPAEDARSVIPLGVQHRISWTLNLGTLIHLISKRSCWIAQLGFWEPVIIGMLREICQKIDPIFSTLATPPCMKGNKFQGCKFELDNEKRTAGEDPLPPCSLYCFHKSNLHWDDKAEIVRRPDYQAMCIKYKKFWGRDANTGQAII